MDQKGLKKWFVARNLFLGLHSWKPDIKRGLELAALCDHPDAQWLTSLFPVENGVPSLAQIKSVFLALGPSDTRGLVYAFFTGTRFEGGLDFVERSARLGNALAQSCFSRSLAGYDRFVWAEKGAKGGDPLGMETVALCYWKGIGVMKSESLAREWWVKASELGELSSLHFLGDCFYTGSQPERYRFWAKGECLLE